MAMAVLYGYCLVIRERALAAFLVLANHGLVMGKGPQSPDFLDGDSGLVPLVFSAFNVHDEQEVDLFGHSNAVAHSSVFSIHFYRRQLPSVVNAGLYCEFAKVSCFF